MNPEAWLSNRLQSHGVDIYAGGPFASLRERIAYVIVTNRYGAVVCGRHDGKPETYAEVFERIYGASLPKPSQLKCST